MIASEPRRGVGAVVVRLALASGLGLLGAALLAGPAAPQAGDRPTVLVVALDHPVTPIMADHLQDALAAAEAGGHEALIVEIDTPGGLDAGAPVPLGLGLAGHGTAHGLRKLDVR